MQNKLTVTIPSFRQQHLLTRALQSLKDQTFKDFNVIIIDDNSGENLTTVINKYSSSLKITLIVNKENLGAMKNMYKSIYLESNSDYIFSYHEDDFIKRNYLETAVDILDTDKKISFVLSSGSWVKQDHQYLKKDIENKNYNILSDTDFIISTLNFKTFIFGSVVYRRRDLGNLFLRLEEYGTLCDKVFLIEILNVNASMCAYLPEPAIYVRDHSQDKIDTRSTDTTIFHIINYHYYYKKILKIKNIPECNKMITNALIFSYSNYSNTDNRIPLFQFYKQQKKYNLIYLSKINSIGIYALFCIFLGKKISTKIKKIIKN